MARADTLTGSIRGLRRHLGDGIRIDTRSLAIFRVLAGCLLVADVLLRSRNFAFYYTDDGMVPQALAEQLTTNGAFSFFFYTSNPDVIAALFAVQALVGVVLVLGYKTRIVTALAFLFVISTDHHNPLVTSYADTLYRLLLFWAIFLPLGERYSIDAVHRERSPRRSFVGIASALILFQMVYMYLVNGVHKRESTLWTSGEAAALVMGLDEMTFLIGDTVRQFPELLEIGGLVWFYSLLLSPLLLVLTGRLRYLFVAVFAGGHLSFALTVRIGAFAYVALAGLTLFLPAVFWRDVATAAGLAGRSPATLDPLRDRLIRAAERVPDVRFDSPSSRDAKAALYTVAFGIVVVSLVVFSTVTFLHVGGIVEEDELTADRDIDRVADRFSVDQPNWGVFAPHPRTTDRYYVFAGLTESNDVYDVYNDRPLAYDRPHDELQKQHETYRMRFYMNSIRRGHGDDPSAQELLADHLCETWEAEDGDRLVGINMYEITEQVTWETIDDHENREAEWRRFYLHSCDPDGEPFVIHPEPEDIPRIGR